MIDASTGAAGDAGRILEAPARLPVPLVEHGPWVRSMPWLSQGTTWPGRDGSFDLGLSGVQPAGAVLDRWRALAAALGAACIVHARQVHGARVRLHEHCPDGILLQDGFDGHLTRAVGLAVTVSVADCVPVFLVDPGHRAIGLLHAGWRGIADGVVEAGILAMTTIATPDPGRIRVHLGPAICGACYEVGPEVFARLKLPVPAGPATADLRAVVRQRAVQAGIVPDHITISRHCTRCGPGRFFSHRAGASGRQMAVMSLRCED